MRYADTEIHALFLTEDVAKATGISCSTIRQYVRDGALNPRKGWSTEAGRPPRSNRRCWLFTGGDLNTIHSIREERRLALSRGLDTYWANLRSRQASS